MAQEPFKCIELITDLGFINTYKSSEKNKQIQAQTHLVEKQTNNINKHLIERKNKQTKMVNKKQALSYPDISVVPSHSSERQSYNDLNKNTAGNIHILT